MDEVMLGEGKPVMPATFIKVPVHSFAPTPHDAFPPATRSEPASAETARTDRDGRRVLVVDDDASILRLLRMIFREADFEVMTCVNGQEALDIVEREEPGAIVLDLEMPVMDGRTFVRELRARGYQTPVLILSAYGARKAQRELNAQGGIDKPFDPDTVVDAVTSLLRGDD